MKRRRAEIARRFSRKGHELLYFHRADDPYCQIMVQVLPDLAARFDITIKPMIVERLPANMYPDPARYEANSIIDASRLARLYGLGFPQSASVPDRLSVGMANRYLASIQDDPDFMAIAEEIGAALWRQDLPTVKRLCLAAEIDEAQLEKNEMLLRSLGHYASGVVYYSGEFYPGVDRLDHLERRLNRLGLGDEEVHFELTRLWRHALKNLDKSVAGRTVEIYFSVRSPYSYLALHTISEFADISGVRLKLKPVLPMVMRGLAVPPAKGRFILADTAREAKIEGLKFGRIADPLGSATKRAMAIGFSLLDGGDALTFFKAFTEAVWSEGVDGATDEGLLKILRKAGLPASVLGTGLAEAAWQEKAEKNRQEMLMYGSWGVPTFRVAGETLWGQDRLWAIVEALKQE
ncbi:MAG: DsbA family protein [Kordiimonadaceae bacterium]|nr:DsbA family protein [Kordiimonadaceae bacterium]